LLNKLCEELKSDFKKERHPILLNDVLEWMKGLDLDFFEYSKKRDELLSFWNLPKPKLSDQSQELIDALCDLIPKQT